MGEPLRFACSFVCMSTHKININVFSESTKEAGYTTEEETVPSIPVWNSHVNPSLLTVSARLFRSIRTSLMQLRSTSELEAHSEGRLEEDGTEREEENLVPGCGSKEVSK